MAAVLVGDDTNLLVLLLHHAGHQNRKIFFAPEPKKNSKSCIWDMGEIQRRLVSYVCRQLLFTHAMLGYYLNAAWCREGFAVEKD